MGLFDNLSDLLNRAASGDVATLADLDTFR